MAQLYYSPVTINTGQVPSTQTDFPILVSYIDARFKTTGNGGHVANANGYDIRPYSDSALTTAITGYELERYNATTGEVIMWVKRSSVADGLVTYLGYGDTSLTTDGSSTTTWSNGFLGVWHLKDGSTLTLTNSASASFNGTNHSATATAGKIDGGAAFASASSQYVDFGTGIYGPAGNVDRLTQSIWVKGTTFPNGYNGAIDVHGSGSSYAQIFVKSTGKAAWYVSNTIAPDVNVDPGSATLSTGTWYYLVMTYDGQATPILKTYVNASSDGTAGTATKTHTVAGDEACHIGHDVITSGRFFNGALDEPRVSNVARSANWITTEYNNQNAPSTFATLGTEVPVVTTRPGWFLFF